MIGVALCTSYVYMCRYFLITCPRVPLFSFQSSRLVTKKSVVSLLRDAAGQASLPHNSLKGHSFCIGAASTAAAAGLLDWLIKGLGRWSSDRLYIPTPQNVLLPAAPRIASVSLGWNIANFLFLSFSLGGYMLRSNFPRLIFTSVICQNYFQIHHVPAVTAHVLLKSPLDSRLFFVRFVS